MRLDKLDSPFLNYLIERHIAPGDRLPTLAEIGQELGMSVGKLREQLEVARSEGFVSVRPRLGIQREPFDFAEVMRNGMLFGIATGEASFEQFSHLRQTVELGFWDTAVVALTDADIQHLQSLVNQAWGKLRGDPIHVPNAEHRELHLTIFRRLDNPFVQGVLEAYWDAYEATELTRFVTYDYWLEVWTYHEQIVAALHEKDFVRGQQLLKQHFSLLRPLPAAAADIPTNQLSPNSG